MGRRGGSSADPLEWRVPVTPVSLEMRSQGTAPAPTTHDDKLGKILEAIEATGQDLRITDECGCDRGHPTPQGSEKTVCKSDNHRE
ncbi:hypothetical protein NDU88_001748 [Pleurodeles waltl]|uniref:Uncharacterized protein n=1 Tax=Pleurodeles waltl TaxID=8319 RepID=A0AAV7SBQ6_PLEWA|nr:hypothetical protein NDU88_001748 [Pleurodeles waltl]